LLDAAPDADPLVLVNEIERIYRGCGDPADQAARLVDAMVDNGLPRALAECAVAGDVADQVPRDFAIRVVYGPRSDEGAAADARTHVAMLRCGAPALREQMRSQGAPELFVDCLVEQQLSAAAEIEADPASIDVILGEAFGEARNAHCVRMMPPATARGKTLSTVGTERFLAAVAEELAAHRLARLTSTQASCLAARLADLVEPARPVTAVQLVGYLNGGYQPSELGLKVDATTFVKLAAGTIECAGTEMLRLTALFDGNIEDALGRPSEPAAENNDLIQCSFSAVELDLVEAFLAQRFERGPDAWRGPEGRALLTESFRAVQRCADQLGIPRQEPLNGM
jgi:hypothetical protein